MLAQRSRRAAAWLHEHSVGFPVLIDEHRTVAKAYGVWHPLGLDALNIARPALFIVDSNGTIRSIFVARSQAEFPSHGDILHELGGLAS